MPLRSVSFELSHTESSLLPLPPYKLIYNHLPELNYQLNLASALAYVVYFSNTNVSIRVIKSGTPSLVSKVYFIHGRHLHTLNGSGFSIHYNSKPFIKEEFSFQWNRSIGLSTLRKDEIAFFPSYSKELTSVLIRNYRKLWNVK